MEKRHEHNEVSKFDFHLFYLYVIACQEKHTKLLYWNKITQSELDLWVVIFYMSDDGQSIIDLAYISGDRYKRKLQVDDAIYFTPYFQLETR